jgi:4a-hydroxytetrahydrobiopterin dehydratase
METATELQRMHCVPCEGGEKPLSEPDIRKYLEVVPAWKATPGPRLTRTFKFRDFKQAMEFVNRMAAIAEAEGHHPDFFVHWNEVRVELWTHATGGLHLNDFILAAKIDAVEKPASARS